jgi:hypothetical protein
MSIVSPKTFISGAGLVWRRQRVLWWIFIVNLILAALSTRGIAERSAATLDHSLASLRLVNQFDLSAFLGLFFQPEAPFDGAASAVSASSVLFLLFMLFITGGVLTCYRDDQKPTSAPFFEACGRHFWRFFRLMIYFLIVLIPVGILVGISARVFDRINDRSISPFPAVRFIEAAAVIILFLMMSLRLWFDIAQVIAVAEDEHRIHRALRSAAVLVRRNFGSLFWLYLRISVVGWILFAAGLHIWMFRLRPEGIHKALVLSQLMILFWLGTRLWQRASEMHWYQKHQSALVASAPSFSPAPAAAPPAAPFTPTTN